MDFQAAIEHEIEKLHRSIAVIALTVVRDALNSPTRKSKSRAPTKSDRNHPAGPVGAWKPSNRRRTKWQATAPMMDISIGSLWRRRDGKDARKVLAVDAKHVTVESPKYHEGTKVKLAEFAKRYKKFQPGNVPDPT